METKDLISLIISGSGVFVSAVGLYFIWRQLQIQNQAFISQNTALEDQSKALDREAKKHIENIRPVFEFKFGKVAEKEAGIITFQVTNKPTHTIHINNLDYVNYRIDPPMISRPYFDINNILTIRYFKKDDVLFEENKSYSINFIVRYVDIEGNMYKQRFTGDIKNKIIVADKPISVTTFAE